MIEFNELTEYGHPYGLAVTVTENGKVARNFVRYPEKLSIDAARSEAERLLREYAEEWTGRLSTAAGS